MKVAMHLLVMHLSRLMLNTEASATAAVLATQILRGGTRHVYSTTLQVAWQYQQPPDKAFTDKMAGACTHYATDAIAAVQRVLGAAGYTKDEVSRLSSGSIADVCEM